MPKNNVTPILSGSSSGGGGGDNELHERVTELETKLNYVATKEDLLKLEISVKESFMSNFRWLAGIIVTILIGLGLIIVNLYK